MEPDDIERLGRDAFQQHLKPCPAPQVDGDIALVGWDTEYADDGDDLLASQMTHQGAESYLTFPEGHGRLSLADLERQARSVAPHAERVYLISYWTTAELSQMRSGWWDDAKVKRVHSAEVYNVSWVADDDSRFTIYDLWHFFFPKSLGAVAPGFGYQKLEWDRARITRDDLKRPGFREYAMNDSHIAEGIMRALRARYLRHGVDILATKTPAGASMAAYRSRYLPAPVTQTDMPLRRLAMRANKGGIAEAFACGTFTTDPGCVWQQWDVDSLYPSAAQALRGFPMSADEWRYARRAAPPEGAEGVCKVRFAFPDDEQYPSLPVVVDKLGMGYPLRGVSYCTVAEAQEASAAGARVDWLQCYHYDPLRGDDSFQRYMTAMRAEKARCDEAGDAAGRIVAKNLLNTGIGKLSQRRKGVDIEDAKKMAKDYGVPLEAFLEVGFRAPEKQQHSPGECWMPEWHALILGKARALMWPVIRTGRSLVTSTDSVIVHNDDARAAGLVGREVGAKARFGDITLNLEAQGDVCQVVRQRLYRLAWQDLPGWGDGKRKVAHHALHARSDDAEWLMLGTPVGSEQAYPVRKKGTLRDAIRGVRDFGSRRDGTMSYKAKWGGKRCLLPDGSSRPWRDAAEWAQGAMG